MYTFLYQWLYLIPRRFARPLTLFYKSSYTYAPTQLNTTPCERSPARLQFQHKTLTFEFPHEKNRGEQTVEAFGGELKFNQQSLSPPASPYVATLLATNLLVSIRLIDKRQVLLHSNYDPVQLLVHIRKSIWSAHFNLTFSGLVDKTA